MASAFQSQMNENARAPLHIPMVGKNFRSDALDDTQTNFGDDAISRERNLNWAMNKFHGNPNITDYGIGQYNKRAWSQLPDSVTQHTPWPHTDLTANTNTHDIGADMRASSFRTPLDPRFVNWDNKKDYRYSNLTIPDLENLTPEQLDPDGSYRSIDHATSFRKFTDPNDSEASRFGVETLSPVRTNAMIGNVSKSQGDIDAINNLRVGYLGDSHDYGPLHDRARNAQMQAAATIEQFKQVAREKGYHPGFIKQEVDATNEKLRQDLERMRSRARRAQEGAADVMGKQYYRTFSPYQDRLK